MSLKLGLHQFAYRMVKSIIIFNEIGSLKGFLRGGCSSLQGSVAFLKDISENVLRLLRLVGFILFYL